VPMAKKKRTPDDRWQQWLADLDDEFRNEILLNESDRGAVLIATAFIEEALEHLLRQVFAVKSRNSSSDKFAAQLNKLVKPGIDAPLGSFAARISTCFVLGIIDTDYFKAPEATTGDRKTSAETRCESVTYARSANRSGSSTISIFYWSYVGLQWVL